MVAPDGPESSRSQAALSALPILPLRNAVLFPASVVPVSVGRPRSVRLVQDLLGQERAYVGILSQRAAATNHPTFADVHLVGTLARVVKVIRQGPANYSVVVSGMARIKVEEPLGLEPYMRARVSRIASIKPQLGPDGESDVELDALAATLREAARDLMELMPSPPSDGAKFLDQVGDIGALADLITANFLVGHADVAQKQAILEATDIKVRTKLVLSLLAPQLEVLRVRNEVSTLVGGESQRNQREELLRQQMSTIRQALGESDDDDELEVLRRRVLEARPTDEASKVARKQLKRLRGMAPQSAEYNVTRTYVEWIADLPWTKATPDNFDVARVRQCLDEDHYGLKKVKRRIVEFSAIRKLRKDMRGPILLFVGPPGVGKTSLGRSIARATGRQYERIALGGVRDESEIRGHRRTYVGALPGRVIKALKRAKSCNPVMVLDEIEKMTSEMRGDPAAALLEVLDPEQNANFRDHYMEVPFNLSQVMFVATANTLRGIAPALLDRMEVIRVPGYTRDEKVAIARDYLVHKQLSQHGLTEEVLDFVPEGVATLVDYYTREAGVRGLERQIAAVCRDTAVRLAKGEHVADVANRSHIEGVLGPHTYRPENREEVLRPGIATGLASTMNGGRLLFVEASKMPGKGRIVLTGNMRNVMQESAATAVSYVRSKAEELHLDPEWLRHIDLHLHMPQHGIPKDGPSSGLAMFAAVCSLLLDCSLRPDVAVTGEVTLRGRVLKVGDLTQKLLAAHRAGIREVVIPERNRQDLHELPELITNELKIHCVGSLQEVLPHVLAPPLTPADDGADQAPAAVVAVDG